MFDSFLSMAGGVNAWAHFRSPTPVEAQPVIRMNRDTLYSAAIVDISEGATLTLPDSDGRYVSVMAVNGEHYINRVYSESGRHELTIDEHGTPYVALVARVFIDPADPGDVAAVNALQDQLAVEARSARPYQHPDYDDASLTATRDALLALGKGIPNADRTFGAERDVDATRHLIGTAVGWGGLPEREAYYYIDAEPQTVGIYTLTLRDVPVDAFWSVTVYNRAGYLEPNPYGAYSINSVTATMENDGSVVLNLAPEPGDRPNHLYVMDGWNYALRLYRPRPAVLDSTWTPPKPAPAR
jgi:hypothetical protein